MRWLYLLSLILSASCEERAQKCYYKMSYVDYPGLDVLGMVFENGEFDPYIYAIDQTLYFPEVCDIDSFDYFSRNYDLPEFDHSKIKFEGIEECDFLRNCVD